MSSATNPCDREYVDREPSDEITQPRPSWRGRLGKRAPPARNGRRPRSSRPTPRPPRTRAAPAPVAAFELRRLRVGALAYSPIAVDHDGRDALIDAAAEHPDAGVLRLLNDRVRRIRNGLQVFVREDHGGTRKRDQILGHRVDSFFAARGIAFILADAIVPRKDLGGPADAGARSRIRLRAADSFC